MDEQQKEPNVIEVETALSVLTVPFLGGLVGARSLLAGLITLGEVSEEVFRGDRLPILHLQQQNETEIKGL